MKTEEDEQKHGGSAMDIEDAADRDARNEAARQAALEAELARRSAAVRRDLPRPSTVNPTLGEVSPASMFFPLPLSAASPRFLNFRFLLRVCVSTLPLCSCVILVCIGNRLGTQIRTSPRPITSCGPRW